MDGLTSLAGRYEALEGGTTAFSTTLTYFGWMGVGVYGSGRVVEMIDYYQAGGQNWSVAIKTGLDVGMAIATMFPPYGTAVGVTYFLVDLGTDGFNGWGDPRRR